MYYICVNVLYGKNERGNKCDKVYGIKVPVTVSFKLFCRFEMF